MLSEPNPGSGIGMSCHHDGIAPIMIVRPSGGAGESLAPRDRDHPVSSGVAEIGEPRMSRRPLSAPCHHDGMGPLDETALPRLNLAIMMAGIGWTRGRCRATGTGTALVGRVFACRRPNDHRCLMMAGAA